MHHAINEYQLRLNVQRFLWPVYYIVYYIILSSKVTTPQDADRKLALQLYLDSNTSEFSAIHRSKMAFYNSFMQNCDGQEYEPESLKVMQAALD